MTAGNVVLEDTTHDNRLGFEDLEVSRNLCGALHPPVAIRRLPRDDLTATRSPQLAAAVALGDLRLLVLGDHSLDLGQEPGLRIVVERWRIGEKHPHVKTFKLVEHKHLVGVCAGQAVRRQAPHGLEQPGFSCVPQSVETRSVEAGA